MTDTIALTSDTIALSDGVANLNDDVGVQNTLNDLLRKEH